MACTAWTYRRNIQHQISIPKAKGRKMAQCPGTISSHHILTPQRSPTSVNAFGSLPVVVSDQCTTVRCPEDGVPVYLQSMSPLYSPKPTGDQEWTTVETVLIRLNVRSAEFGHFPVQASKVDPISGRMDIGYDAAVCVQRYEPWIIRTYNTSIASPSALQIVGKGNASFPLPPSGNIRGVPTANATRYLNTTGKDGVFGAAHPNTVTQLQKDSQGILYSPSSTVGPIVPPRTPFLLTFTRSTGSFFH